MNSFTVSRKNRANSQMTVVYMLNTLKFRPDTQDVIAKAGHYLGMVIFSYFRKFCIDN